MSLPVIYPITDTQIANLSHAEQAARLIDGGAKLIQLRDKRASPKEFYRQALEALKIARASGVKILINDRVDIALAVRADGVHLGQHDLPPVSARQILGEKAIVGYSTHDLTQVSEALQMPIDYIAIGPVFPTTTKENPDKVVGLDFIKQARRLIGDFPLVAIGGITSQNFRDVLRSGADSTAMIGELLTNADEISSKMRRLQIMARQ